MTFAHLTIATRDVGASVNFFAKALGWERIERPANVDREVRWLRIAPGQELHVIEAEDFEATPIEREYGRHVAIFRKGAEFPQLKQRLSELGAEIIAPLRETPFERFFFRDPNGYIFEVIDEDGYRSET